MRRTSTRLSKRGLNQRCINPASTGGLARSRREGTSIFGACSGLMTMSVIHYNKNFRGDYENKKQTGMPHKKAVMATMHKLIRMLFCHAVT
jgi:hypothetical protein